MRKTWISGLLAVAGGLVVLMQRKGKGGRRPKTRTLSRIGDLPLLAKRSQSDVAIERFMLYFMLPLWFVPGLLDHYWHRKTKIETTAGTQESAIHSLMMMEVGLPIVGGLLLEINAGVIALMIAAYLVHQATAMWDVAFAVARRKVFPREQHTHSFLEMLPFCAVSFIICLHWDQFTALLGVGDEEPRFAIRLKRPPVPPAYIAGVLGAVGVFIVLPYGEELLRCIRAQRQGLIGTESPEEAKKLFGEVTPTWPNNRLLPSGL